MCFRRRFCLNLFIFFLYRISFFLLVGFECFGSRIGDVCYGDLGDMGWLMLLLLIYKKCIFFRLFLKIVKLLSVFFL